MSLSERSHGRSARFPSRRWSTVLAATALAMLLGACEGDTLYDGDIAGPSILAPDSLALLEVDVHPRFEDAQSRMSFRVQWKPAESVRPVQWVGISARVTAPSFSTPVYVRIVEDPVGSSQRQATLTATYAQLLSALPVQPAVGEVLSLEVGAYAINSAGRCVAAVLPEMQQLPCELRGDVEIASGVSGVAVSVLRVDGTTVALPPNVALIGDLVVHNASNQLFVSNRLGQTLEVLQLGAPGGPTFRSTGVPVGSHPWGLNLNLAGNEVIVANSGGTSFSFVSVASLQERRLDIPRMTLHDLRLDVNDGKVTCTTSWHNYTDRPQFVAQDSDGRLLYSAASSAVVPTGTIRMARVPAAGQQLSGGFLFPGAPNNSPLYTPPNEARGVEFARDPDEDFGWLDFAVANLDSLTHHTAYAPPFFQPTCEVTLHDHIPGSPQQLIRVGPVSYLQIENAISALHALGSDVLAAPGYRWQLNAGIVASDTTYVGASGNHDFIAFGEGVRFPDARVTMWSASTLMSRFDDMADLRNNTSDRMTGIALNADGSLGVARGRGGAYFFNRELRLQGTASAGLADGVGGVAMMTVGNRSLAFVGTSDRSIQIIESQHYRPIAEIPIRDNVIGAIRVGPGRRAGDGATVYAVTEGGVLVLGIPQSQLQ